MSDDILPFEGVMRVLGENVFVAPGAKVIGDVHIGSESSIWYGCILRGDVNEIRIGARTNIQDGTVIHVSSKGQGTYIGDDIAVGHMALLHACTLEDRAFVGMKAVIMDGAVVETGGMVAAGALITPGKRVKTGELWTGWPAKYARQLIDKDREMMTWTQANYVRLAQKHKVSLT